MICIRTHIGRIENVITTLHALLSLTLFLTRIFMNRICIVGEYVVIYFFAIYSRGSKNFFVTVVLIFVD